MLCDREELLSRFVDNDLDQREAGELRAHFSECPACKVRLHELQESERAFREIINTSFPTGILAEKVMFRIQKEMPDFYPLPAPATFRWWKLLIPALAGFLFAIMVFSPSAPLPTKPPVDQPIQASKPESVMVAPLGMNSWADNKKLLIGELVSIDSSVIKEFSGLVALCLDRTGKNRITWEGKGLFSAGNDTINWENGNGEFNFVINRPITLKIQSVSITIHGTRIQISGKAGMSVRINLLEGKASFTTPEGRVFLAENVPILIEGNKIEQLAALAPFGQNSLNNSSISRAWSSWVLESKPRSPEGETGGSR